MRQTLYTSDRVEAGTAADAAAKAATTRAAAEWRNAYSDARVEWRDEYNDFSVRGVWAVVSG